MPQQTCRCRMGGLQTPRADHSCALLSDSAQVFKIRNTIVNVDGYLCIFQSHQNYCQRRRILATHQVLLLGGAQDSAGDIIMDAAQQRLFVLQKTKSSKSMFLKDKIPGELLSLSDQTWRPGPVVPDNITLSSSHLKILPDQKVANSKFENIF